MNYSDRELLAKTIQAEAGNQGAKGMMAVGNVIMNRLAKAGSLSDVILAAGQFSPWNSVTGYAGGEQGVDMAKLKPSEQAYKTADMLLSGNYEDITGGATHFYNPAISNPSWGRDKAGGNWQEIGAHIFGNAGGYRTGKGKTMELNQQSAPQQGQKSGLLGLLQGGGNASEMTPFQRFFQNVDEATGLTPFQRFAAALDPMALPSMRGGDAIRAMGKDRVKFEEERKAKEKKQETLNSTIKFLQKKADAGDKIAAEYLGAISTGSIPVGAALTSYLTASTKTAGSSSKFGEQFSIYKKAYPDKTDAEILKMIEGEAKLPAQFDSLDRQARAAGFRPKSEGGDGRYEEFMASAGAGFKQLAKNRADMTMEQVEALGKTLGAARRTNQLIDSIKSSPYLDGVLGRIEGNISPSSWYSLGVFDENEANLIKMIDNLENSVFLEAFDQLRGGGQISNVEGEKAQRAIVNLSRDRTKQGFIDALNTLQEVINSGAERAHRGATADSPYTKDLDFSSYGVQKPSADKSETPNTKAKPVEIDGYSIIKVD